MSTTYKYVFLSYCHENKAEVATLRQDLIDAGEGVWWDGEILPGQSLELAISQALKQSYAFVLCLSKESQARIVSGIYPEVMAAIKAFSQYSPDSIFLIPVRLSECEIPPFPILESLKYVDLFPAAERANGLASLIRAIQAAPLHP
jgi:hypothetical protein